MLKLILYVINILSPVLCRFIFGSTKVMKVALGQSESQEYQVGLAKVAETLKGTVGLLFTKLPREEVSSSSAIAFAQDKALDFQEHEEPLQVLRGL